MRVRFYIFILIIIICPGCLERYWPDVEKYEELLVVDGTITDAPGPYVIRLSLSSGLDALVYRPLSAALVSVTDDLGNTEYFTQTAEGTYESSPSFQGQVGRKYKLFVQTPDGQDYETDFQELNEVTDIDSVYAKVEMRDTRNPDFPIGGYQFYIDVKPQNNEGAYYYWRMEEAYQYRSAFYIDFIYDGEMHEVLTNQDSVYLCYAQHKRSEIVTYGTKNLREKDIIGLPLVFVSNETPRLSMRYSLLVKQYAISKEAFNYWNGIEKQRGEQGALYSKQPYQIAGNLKNINNPDEPVLGFFMVGGVNEKRIYVGRPPRISIYVFTCQPDEELIGFLSDIPESEYPVYFFRTETDSKASASDFCFDCTLRGGSVEKPDFWDD